MKVLLSIKPEFAYKIFDGEKRFEFRKVIFKNPDIRTIVVYASSPVQKVIGEFEIDDILSSSPNEIWKLTKNYSGISELYFNEYFENRLVAHAIKIKNTKRYKRPMSLKDDFNVLPPQSFLYLNEEATI
jgi:predicted transcriptional regulator